VVSVYKTALDERRGKQVAIAASVVPDGRMETAWTKGVVVQYRAKPRFESQSIAWLLFRWTIVDGGPPGRKPVEPQSFEVIMLRHGG
jgi:hypothetical protein